VDSFSSSLDVAMAESGLRTLALVDGEKVLPVFGYGEAKRLKSSLPSSMILLLNIF